MASASCNREITIHVKTNPRKLHIHVAKNVNGCCEMARYGIKIRPFTAKRGFSFAVPRGLFEGNKDMQISFGKKTGKTNKAEEFIFSKLVETAKQWTCVADIKSWVSNRRTWKPEWIAEWKRLPDSTRWVSESAPTKRPCAGANAAGTSAGACKKRCMKQRILAEIPVEGFPPLMTIRLKEKSVPKGRTLVLFVPHRLTNNNTNSPRKVQFGKMIDDIPGDFDLCIKFIKGYIETNVDNWRTLADAKAWSTTNNLKLFTQHVMLAWMKNFNNLFWEFRKSQVATAELQVDSFNRKGTGVFCTKEGRYTIYFGEMPFSKWIKHEIDKGSKVERYALGGDERKGYSYFVPTKESFATGVIHHGFKICHAQAEKATHDLLLNKKTWKYYLKPRKGKEIMKVDTEFTFNYNLKEVR